MTHRDKVLEFGPFRLDAASRSITREGVNVNLTPKVFDTLLYLIEHRGRVLSKEELLTAIWEGRRVEEANLTQNISVLRRALGESADGVKYILTFPGRGYQFQAEVREPPPSGEAPAPQPAAPAARSRPPWIWAGIALASVAAAILFFATRAPREPEFVRRPLTRLPGAEFQPALSPDGLRAAFVADEEGQQTAIFVHGPEEDAPRRLTPPGERYVSPAWSPDGRSIAYLRLSPDEATILISQVRGGQPRELCRLFPHRYGLMFRHLDWSPDGRWIVADDKERDAQPLGLFLIDVETGQKRRLTLPEQDVIGDTEPRFSPDGRRVAFARLTSRFEHEVAVVPTAGGAPFMVTGDRRQIGGLDWLPHGREILFSSNRGGQFQLYQVPFSGGRPRPRGISGFASIQLSLARRGERLAVAEVQEDLNLWRVDFGAAGRPATWQRVIASTATEALPQVSPDGTRICFRSDRSGDDQLWVAALDGSNPRQLTRSPHRPFAGKWSPDGKTLVFGHVVGGPVYTVSADGGVPSRVPEGASGCHPLFFPDGISLLDDSPGTLQKVNLRTRTVTRLVRPSQEAPHGTQLAPDGQSIYFVPGRTGRSIWKGSLVTNDAVRVIDGLVAGSWGSWVLGRSAIWYLGHGPEDPKRPWILRHDLATGERTPIAPWEGPAPPMGSSYWALTPDERSLFVVRVDRSNSDIVMLDAFR